MPILHSRPMLATDFEDIALFDHKDAKEWRRRGDLNGIKKAPPNIIIPNTEDLHASVQSVSSTISVSTTTSDTSSLRSSLSSISSPALANAQFGMGVDHTSPGGEAADKKTPASSSSPVSALQKALDDANSHNSSAPQYGRRRSVPALLDNTSMASLTIKATNGSRSRKQRELEFEADQDDDIWPGDTLMFNVPMSPALYAQQKIKHYQLNDPHKQSQSHHLVRTRPMRPDQTSGKHPINQDHNNAHTHGQFGDNQSGTAEMQGESQRLKSRGSPAKTAKPHSPLQHQIQSKRSRSFGLPKHNSLPSIHEARDASASNEATDTGFDFTSYECPGTSLPGPYEHNHAPYYQSADNISGMAAKSLPSLLSRRGSCADSSVGSIDGLNPDASEITIELCKLEEEQAIRRSSSNSTQSRNRPSSDAGDNTMVSISSLVTSDTDAPLPSPAVRNSEDGFNFGSGSNGNDSRRSSLTRPENLPPKSPEEERKHMKEYERLLKDAAAAEKKKQQKREEQSKLRAQQVKQDSITWTNWLSKGSSSRLSSDLKWRGVPERLRGAVWFRLKGGDTRILDDLPPPNATYHRQIIQDTEKLWPECAIFGVGRPLHESLVNIVERCLGSRPEFHYSQSLVGIAGLLLLYLDPPQALLVLLNLFEPGSLPFSILSRNERLTSANYVSFQKVFEAKFENLSAHFVKKNVTNSELLNPLVSSIFTTVMPTPENAARILDVFIFDGDSFLLRAALGVLRMNEAWLFASKAEIIHQMQYPRVESEDDMMKMIRDVTRK